MSYLFYYRNLARDTPAPELIRILWRKAVSRGRLALRSRRDSAQVRTLQVPVQSSAWCHPSQRKSVLQALSALPDLSENAVRDRARKALRNEFEIFGTSVSFATQPSVDWSLDCISGHQYPLSDSTSLALIKPGRDPKYPWAMGRLDQLIALAQGYWISSKSFNTSNASDYVEAFIRQTTHFIQSNPLGRGIHWTCAMEVSLRASNMIQAYWMFSDADEVLSEPFVEMFSRSIAEHVDFVQSNLEDTGWVPNNHLVADWVGLLVVASLFTTFPNREALIKRASKALRHEMETQVHFDGYAFEGSVPYHRLSIELFTLGYLASRVAEVPMGGAFVERLHRMYHVSHAYCSEKGLAPQIGDNDSGRVLGLTDRPSLDHGYLSFLGAALFTDPQLKHESAAFSSEAAWLLGEEGLRAYQALRKSDPELPSKSFPSGGLHILRGGGAVVSVSAGPHGQKKVGGHNHNDQLSFEMHVNGQPVIVDSGSPTYGRDPPLRNQFRSTAHHNTVQIDGRELSPFSEQRLFSLPDHTHTAIEAFVVSPEVDRLSAAHRGFGLEGISVQRTFSLDKKNSVLWVQDELKGQDTHWVQSRLHCLEMPVKRPLANDERERLLVLSCDTTWPDDVFQLGSLATVVPPRACEMVVQTSQYSQGYGEIRESHVLVMEGTFLFPSSLSFVVLFNGRNK